jgi:hypothetical protein
MAGSTTAIATACAPGSESSPGRAPTQRSERTDREAASATGALKPTAGDAQLTVARVLVHMYTGVVHVPREGLASSSMKRTVKRTTHG